MKVGIYTPYLDSFGGGERYMLTIAEILSNHHLVDLLIDQHYLDTNTKTMISDLSKRFNLDLSKINLRYVPMGTGLNTVKRLMFFRTYDLLIALTDGSIFYSTAKRSILHFQVPFKNTLANNLWRKIKLSSWELAICNSKFTKDHISRSWSIKTNVIYPPVQVDMVKPLKKEKWIISVGRFASFSKSKKHEVMIQAFAELHKTGKIDDWSLHLAGSVEGDDEYVNELKKTTENLPVSFYPNLQFRELVKLYGRSSIYWHAAGFGEVDPAKMEHFGISTVEAMAAGCVPIVINLGGQKEIVEEGISGYLWDDIEELLEKTLRVVINEKIRKEVGSIAVKEAQKFSVERFSQEICQLVDGNN